MPRLYLQDMLDDVSFDTLPTNWTAFNLTTFSKSKTLWGYQQQAVRNVINILWKYYEDLADYQAGETPEKNAERKQKMYQWYKANGLEEEIDISLEGNQRIASLLAPYYTARDDKISYEQFINRGSFWMATGSGKTLVIVKLIEVLRGLIKRGEIPAHDILVLTHRDDLIKQLKNHVQEFNAAQSDLFIHLRELREYAEAKRNNPALFKEREATVFYYRSDNVSDEQKERIIDFRNYDDEGKWYVLLDEAHKGDREDSKRQQIYSILSRNGFLFNFSATFTDARDLITTIYNFNLSEYIKAGYGKHIAILKQELRAFRDEQDYNNEEKQKIVLKSLLMLAYTHKAYERIRRVGTSMYHKPLLLTLVNSVNIEEADLKLFFREIERIGKGEVGSAVWKAAKQEMWEELREHTLFMFEEGETLQIDQAIFDALEITDILKAVYNSRNKGEIEILVRPSNKQELAFKLKPADRPFALIKIGDISGWLKDTLAGYEINERFEDETYFERLNTDDSDINILMGSRSFYEGWDSNRPNVINFINIGTGTDARKFILQSIGRGVRIEPIPHRRKRLLHLYNANEVDKALFEKIKDKVQPLESLLIFGTNRIALQKVIGHLNQESRKTDQQPLPLFVNKDARKRTLLIPTYKLADQPIVKSEVHARFEIESSEIELLKTYLRYIGDDRVLLALYDTEPQKIALLNDSATNSERYYKERGRKIGNVDLLVERILEYFSVIPEELKGLKRLEEEIRHFKNVTVSLTDISELTSKVEKVRQFEDPEATKRQLKEKFERKELTLEEYTLGIEHAARLVREERAEYKGKRLVIRNVVNHYYVPIILSGETERIDYIKHIIQTPSEVRFINQLEEYIIAPKNRFKELDWWMFSKLDESLDEVYIPWYDAMTNRIRKFNPDFIFWLQKAGRYFILFIDPKGTEHTEYQRKIDGYSEIFEVKGETKKEVSYNGVKAKVFMYLKTDDVDGLPKQYRKYWFEDIGSVLTSIIEGT